MTNTLGASARVTAKAGTETESHTSVQRSHDRLLYVILAAVALLYVVTLRPGQPWHDDFALYILHARNLVEGIPYADTGFIYNPASSGYSPEVYPPGFPLLLAPVYAVLGANLFALRLVVVASFVAAVAAFAALARPALPSRFALAAVALVAFQPFFVRFKNLLLPDFSFVLFVLMSLYLIRRLHENSKWTVRDLGWAVLAGACIYLAISMRTVGVTLFGALFLYHIFRRRLPGVPILVCVAVALVLYAAQSAWMPPAAGYAAQFTDAAASSGAPLESALMRQLKRVFAANDKIRMFTGTDVLWAARGELRAPDDGGLSRALTVFLMFATAGLALLGYLLRLRRPTIVEMFVLSYMGVLVLWGAAAVRYLIPVFPLLLFYAVVGIAFLSAHGGRAVRAGAMSLAVLVCGMYVVNLARVDRSPYADSVTGPEAAQLFSHITRCTRPTDRLVAQRPRAITLYTGRASTSPGLMLRNDETFVGFLETTGIQHVVTTPESVLEEAASTHPASFMRTFRNDRFAVYAYRPAASEEPAGIGC